MTVFMSWNKSMDVGVKKFNDQHKQLIAIANKAYVIAKNGKTHGSLAKLINELLEFARVHFSTEEFYFDKFNYPDAEEHKLEHAELTEDALNYDRRFRDGEDVARELLDFFKKWVDNHLKTYDKKYTKFFHSVGLK